MSFIPPRKEKKGENGRILVIGGSKDYVGAPFLAGMACLRAGADLVTIAAPEDSAWIINSYSPDIITKKIPGEFFNPNHIKPMLHLADKFDVILIGNGMGLRQETAEFTREFVKHCPKPKVIDADAIKHLQGEILKLDNAILTPHSREFEILIEEHLPKKLEEKADLLRKYAKQRLIILLKGKDDIIVDKENIRYNATGNNGMTMGGTGDVLAGITASFLAQSNDFLESAEKAAYLNGKVGDYLLKKKGIGFTASDMLDLIPELRSKYI